MATGGKGLRSTEGWVTIEDSICPKGWRLPITGDINADKSWPNLVGVIGASEDPSLDSALRNPPYSLIRPFYYSSALGVITGGGGTWWTATTYDDVSVFDMYLGASNYFNTTNRDVKGDARAIRCVNR